jgi:hypothetical protein
LVTLAERLEQLRAEVSVGVIDLVVILDLARSPGDAVARRVEGASRLF